MINLHLGSGGFEGGKWGCNCPPLHNDNSVWRPLFAETGAPCRDPKALFSELFRSECGANGQTKISFSKKKPMCSLD